MSAPGVIERPEVDDGQTGVGPLWVVTVFDNSHNTYDEVIEILMFATQCSLDEAQMETWEIDHLGKSVVHYGEREECEAAAEIIAEIGIQVKVSQE